MITLKINGAQRQFDGDSDMPLLKEAYNPVLE
jgi:hypothetical protein